MRLEDFKDNLMADVDRARNSCGWGQQMSFVSVMGGLCGDEEGENLECVYAVGTCGTQKFAVDAWAYDDVEGTLVLAQADFDGFTDRGALTKTEAETLFKRLRVFYRMSRNGKLLKSAEPPLDFSTPEYELADFIRTAEIERIRLLIFTDRPISGRFKSLTNEPEGDVAVTEDVWDIKRVWEHVRSKRAHEALELSFEDHPIPLTHATEGEGFRSYLGVISGEKLAQIYHEHGGRLLEGNVRAYLTLKTDVNKGIRKTITEDAPEKFFVYNNGIAATARDLVFNEKKELIRATDFQIINGGQTTASLARARYIDKAVDQVAQIQVAIKLTEIENSLPANEAYVLVRNISRFSNNQNKVSDSDLSSNHEFHVRMERLAERIIAPVQPGELIGKVWFYERNRGSYLQKQMFMSAPDKKAFLQRTDKRHRISKEDFARVRLAWDGLPDVVSKGASKLFARFMLDMAADWDEKRDTGTYGDTYFKDTVSLLIIYNELRAKVSKATWYPTGGYLANIVAYSLSVYSWLFRKTYGEDVYFDFDQVWEAQSTPGAMSDDLYRIAEIVAECLTDPDRDVQNVTEWAKLAACWEAVRKRFETSGFALNDFAAKQVMLEDEMRMRREEDRKREEAGTGPVTEGFGDVLEKAKQYRYWLECLNFNSGKGILEEEERLAIQHCAQMPRKNPSVRELKIAFDSLSRLRAEGFLH